MRKILIVSNFIFLIFLSASFITYTPGQTNDSINTIDSLAITKAKLDSTNSVLLSKNWKYNSGDDSTWADKNFNDSSWMDINTQLYIDSLKEGTWQGIGWFRKEFKIDSSLFGKTVVFTVGQKGASQIFLNGKFIKEYGKVTKDLEKEVLYNPQGIPFVIVLDTSNIQVLAVRYSNHRAKEFAERYKGPAQNAGFSIRIGEADKLIKQSVESEFYSSLISVILAGIL
ncbi:MAG: beta galactosidase jelly roll domain-containing protein, partial [Ignavibacteriaceae bacterium]